MPFIRQLLGDLIIDNFTEPIATGTIGELSSDQWQGVLQELIFPPPSPARSRELIEAPDEQGFGFADRLEKLTRKADDADRVASEISTGFSEGENLQELEKRIRAKAKMVDEANKIKIQEKIMNFKTIASNASVRLLTHSMELGSHQDTLLSSMFTFVCHYNAILT